MTFPLSVFSDLSMSKGNDSPQTLAKVAASQGYSRLALVDMDTMTSTVKFLKSCNGKDGAPAAIVGATLSVHIPSVGEQLWLFENHNSLIHIAETMNIPNSHPLLTRVGIERFQAQVSVLMTCMETPTDGRLSKIWGSLEKAEGALTPSLLSREPEARALLAKGNTRYSCVEKVSLLWRLLFDGNEIEWLEKQENWSSLPLLLTNFKPLSQTVNLMVYSRDFVGYKNLMCLVSMLAKVKQDNLHQGKKDSVAVTLDHINQYREGLLLADPLTNYSAIGSLLFAAESAGEIDKVWPFVEKQMSGVVDVIGVPYKMREAHRQSLAAATLPLIPMPTAHFAEKENYELYAIKFAEQTKVDYTDYYFVGPEKETYIHPYEDVLAYYEEQSKLLPINMDYWDAEISNTAVPLGSVHLPVYDMPVREVIAYAVKSKTGEAVIFDSDEAAEIRFKEQEGVNLPEGGVWSDFRQRRLNDWCMHMIASAGLERRLADNYGDEAEVHRQRYQEQFDYEFSVIESMGFAGYFLILYDAISYGRSINIPVGAGRGSGAGSLIVYCMEITDIDPIVYDLQFERFLNPERVSMPDIDVDIGGSSEANRDTLLQYMREKYQSQSSQMPSFSQIATIGRYQIKSALKTICRAFGLSVSYSNVIAKMVESAELSLGIKAPKTIAWDEFLSIDAVEKRVNREPVLKKVFMMARALTGKAASIGVHAGGVVISPTIIPDYSPVSCDDHGSFFCQYDKDDIESAGLIKFDILGLRTLSLLSECQRQVKLTTGVDIDIRKLPLDDESVYDLICSDVLCDIFQLESAGMRDLVGKLLPQSVSEIAILSALFRPGALDSGMVESYVDVKSGLCPPNYMHPALEKVTKGTNGCIVYQEQVMSIVRELAGYSLGQADLLRRAMGKKKVAEMAKERGVFMGRAMAYWQGHYKAIGEKQGFEFALDVNLADLASDEYKGLGLAGMLNDKGFLASHSSVTAVIAKLLNLDELAINQLEARLSDCDYVVHLFKGHYQSMLSAAVQSVLADLPEEKRREADTRLYYTLSQYVRFNQIFNLVEKFAGYGFNRSHAVAYSVVTYHCAYFKKHYPAEFYAAAMSFRELSSISSTVTEATQVMGVKLLGPDINESDDLFRVQSPMVIRFGLGKLKGVGTSGIPVVAERERGGVYSSFIDLLTRLSSANSSLGSSAFYAMSVTGCFDRFIPRRIAVDKAINGRQFMVWLNSCLAPLMKTKPGKDASKKPVKPWLVIDYEQGEVGRYLHEHIDEMSVAEFVAYFISLISAGELEKMNLPLSPATVLTLNQVELNPLALLSPVDAGLSMDEYCLVPKSGVAPDFSQTKFGKSFLTNVDLILRCGPDVVFDAFLTYLRKICNASVADMLNFERNIAGVYLTSSPIKVLRIADRVEREPPSSVIDGCPVSVGKIDSSRNAHNVTTYGIIRNVAVKTVKKATRNFGETFLTFTLEDGASSINCLIFGTKEVAKFADKIIADNVVAMIAGEVRLNNFGLGIGVHAVRTYYPDDNAKVHVVK